MVIREWLKAGVISYIHLAERVNGSVKTKVLGQGVGLGLELGLIGSEWGEGSLENRSGERVGAPGRERMGEGGGDGEFSGDWRGEW